MLVRKDKKGSKMVGKNFTLEQIINKLREAKVLQKQRLCL